MWLQVMEIPNSTLSPLVLSEIKGEGQGKRERGSKCSQGLSTSLKVPWGCSTGIFVIFPALSWEPVNQFWYL